MEDGGKVVTEREKGGKGRGGGGGSERGAEGKEGGGGGEGGNRQVEVQRGESNVKSPEDESMRGLWV